MKMDQSHWRFLPLVCLTCLALTAVAQTPLDIEGQLLNGSATIETSPYDIGNPFNLFDGNTGSLLRSASVNPLLVTLEFDSPLPLGRSRFWFIAGVNAWQLEGAASRADLDSQSGSYRVLSSWHTGPEWAWNEATIGNGDSPGALRLSLQRLTGDDHVHLCEWELYPPDDWFRITGFDWDIPSSTATIEWGSSSGSWYAIESDPELAAWNLREFVKARSSQTSWQETLSPVPERMFWHVRHAAPEERTHIRKRLLVLNHDPILENEGGIRLHEFLGWNDPAALTQGYLADLAAASGDYVEWELVEWRDLDEWPLKADGFRYTDESYLASWFDSSTHPWHQPDGVDYEAIIQSQGLDELVSAGLVDEVIMWGGPWFGFWESQMVGSNAYWCNSGPITHPGVPNYVIMGINYERGLAEALHSFGHRAESILTHVYGSWSSTATVNHLWDRFTRVTHLHGSDPAGCGNIHFPPNGTGDYDYSNTSPVLLEAEHWLSYPDLSGPAAWVNCDTWGGPDHQRNYLLWWLQHMPRTPGRYTDGKLNNWWGYLLDLNEYAESR